MVGKDRFLIRKKNASCGENESLNLALWCFLEVLVAVAGRQNKKFFQLFLKSDELQCNCFRLRRDAFWKEEIRENCVIFKNKTYFCHFGKKIKWLKIGWNFDYLVPSLKKIKLKNGQIGKIKFIGKMTKIGKLTK